MYVATVIGDGLTLDLIEEISGDLGGQSISALEDGIAYDIFLNAVPESFDVVWGRLQTLEIDLNIQPVEGRRKAVLLADMDSTMIEQECIDELAAEAGVGAHVADITARAMNGELDFEEALNERVGLLQGLDIAVISKVLKERITLMSGGRELLATMKAHGAYCALVSGGFTDFTSAIAAELGFDENRANTLLQKDGKLTGKVGMPILGREAKVEALLQITDSKGLKPSNVIAVGDGANDLGMLQLAGSGVALHAKPVVASQAKLRLNFADLTGLLYLQGYTVHEFVD